MPHFARITQMVRYSESSISDSFSRDPLTDISRAVLELDVLGFASLEKPDGVSIDKGEVFQIQD